MRPSLWGSVMWGRRVTRGAVGAQPDLEDEEPVGEEGGAFLAEGAQHGGALRCEAAWLTGGASGAEGGETSKSRPLGSHILVDSPLSLQACSRTAAGDQHQLPRPMGVRGSGREMPPWGWQGGEGQPGVPGEVRVPTAWTVHLEGPKQVSTPLSFQRCQVRLPRLLTAQGPHRRGAVCPEVTFVYFFHVCITRLLAAKMDCWKDY